MRRDRAGHAPHHQHLPCPVCDGEPRVLLVMSHPEMLHLTRELLRHQFG